jgi:hypothetical protein
MDINLLITKDYQGKCEYLQVELRLTDVQGQEASTYGYIPLEDLAKALRPYMKTIEDYM